VPTPTPVPATVDRLAAELRALAGRTAVVEAAAEGQEVNVRQYGAAPGNTAVANDAGFAAAPTGGVLTVPAGVYQLSQTLTLGSHVSWRGAWGGNTDVGSGAVNGTVLKWAGAAGQAVLRVFNAEYVSVDGVDVDLNNAAGTTGILIDSTNAPATRNVTLAHFNVFGGALGVNGTGVQIGTSGISPAYQTDNVTLRDGHVQLCAVGLHVNSNNAFDAGLAENVRFHLCTTGVRYDAASFHTLRSCIWGADPGVVSTGVLVNSAHSVLLIEQCQMEGGAAGSTFLDVSAVAGPLLDRPITLLSNHVDLPCAVRTGRRLVSVGNYYGQDVTLSGASVAVTSVGDTFAATKDFVLSGTTARVARFSPGYTAPFLEFDGHDVEGDVLRLRGGGINANLALVNTGAGGGSWQWVAPRTGGVLPGGAVLRDAVAGTDPLKAEPGAVTNALTLTTVGVKIGAGAAISTYLQDLAALDFPSIAAGTTANLTVTVAGAAVGDTAVATPNGAPEAGLVWSAYVSAADTVTVRLGNVTAAPIDPADRIWRCSVVRH
jgi:hypothetical protein